MIHKGEGKGIKGEKSVYASINNSPLLKAGFLRFVSCKISACSTTYIIKPNQTKYHFKSRKTSIYHQKSS